MKKKKRKKNKKPPLSSREISKRSLVISIGLSLITFSDLYDFKNKKNSTIYNIDKLLDALNTDLVIGVNSDLRNL